MPLRGLRPLVMGLLTVLATTGMAAPAVAATAVTPVGSATVTGHVVDSAGHPLADFSVLIATRAEDESYWSYSAETDSSGEFTFEDVAPGGYVLLEQEPNWFQADARWPTVAVAAGATVEVPTVTALRGATVEGTLVSAADGSPIADQSVYAEGPSGTTDAAGHFSIVVPPGAVTVRAAGRFWFSGTATTYAAEGATSDLGAVALQPAGLVSASFRAPNGRLIGSGVESVAVDGCWVGNDRPSTCPGVATYAFVGLLQLKPGKHTLLYQLESPIAHDVEQATRTVTVVAGTESAVPDVVVPVVAPATRAFVEGQAYSRGEPVRIRVREGYAADGTRSHLPVTIHVNGHVVRPTSVRWVTRTTGVQVLVATLPKVWSNHTALKVRAVVRGRGDYLGQTTAVVRLVRKR